MHVSQLLQDVYKRQEMDRQIEGVISQTRIQNVRKRLISKLSKGYRQRVGIDVYKRQIFGSANLEKITFFSSGV